MTATRSPHFRYPLMLQFSHMDTNEERHVRLEQKIDAIYASAEKTRKYILIMLIGTVVMFVLPLIMAGFMIPFMMSTLGGVYGV